jgi:hypothetical protein
MAGVPGFEPGLSVLETDVLTVDTIPLKSLPSFNCRLPICSAGLQSTFGNQQSAIVLLGLFVTGMLTATATEFAEFQPIRRRLLVFGRNVVATLTVLTLKHNVIAWHIVISNFRLPIANY